MIQRSEDVGTLKRQEDSKPIVDQQNIQSQMAHKEEAARHQVVKKENSPETENHADAREEGRGVYYTPSRKKKKEEEKKKTDHVVMKNMSGRFDIKV
jgi:hypothetical protein